MKKIHLKPWQRYVLVFVLMLAVNDRAARVEMPPPDNTFGIYRGADSR